MQRQGTLQFWDDYHADHTRQEWISKPSDEVLKMIFEQFHNHGNNHFDDHNNISDPLTVLEIGCGTSTLVRDVKGYFETQYRKQQICRNIHACGTDVSPICIDHLCQRDRHHVMLQNHHHQNNGQLEYKVLNVVDNDASTLHKWDLILDKGCIDTFLFRSRQRGPNADYNDLIQRVLDNLHSWLRSHSGGLYMFISPRTKIKAVRDYQGFSSIHRYTLPPHSLSTLEGTNHDSGYLFVCAKNNNYIPGISLPFRRQSNQQTPKDDTICQHCGVSFLRFRKGESLQTRGAAIWMRQWEGHCKHCK
jgi:Methyltransferase domain